MITTIENANILELQTAHTIEQHENPETGEYSYVLRLYAQRIELQRIADTLYKIKKVETFLGF